MKKHSLKAWPEPFQALVDGRKTYEIRVDDRGYEVGDLLFIQEWIPREESYTGRCHTVVVTYKTPGGHFGLPDDLCVMAVAESCFFCGHFDCECYAGEK
jgi:hypothetical protein